MPDRPPIPIICGPTACGKTGLAIELSNSYPIEVISADSRQVIRYLDIGTAKPTAAERERVAFHLIDIIDPGERYTAYRFIQDADAVIRGILERGHMPLVVGGTGLYLRALTEGVVEIEHGAGEVRDRLEEETAQVGAQEMHRRLAEIDPEEAARIHPNNRVRIIRALEIYHLTGVSKSHLTSMGDNRRSRYKYQYFCCLPNRRLLYRVIEERVDGMIVAGLEAEVQRLVREGRQNALRKANVIGYNEILDYIGGQRTLPEAVSLIKQNSRRYAKRQITWFRHQQPGEMFDDRKDLLAAIRRLLERWRTVIEKT